MMIKVGVVGCDVGFDVGCDIDGVIDVDVVEIGGVGGGVGL